MRDLADPSIGVEIQPALETPRLRLRPFVRSDAPHVQRLAGNPAVADTTAHIPHPYPDGAAEQWIDGHAAAFRDRSGVVYAITLKDGGQLVGAMSLLNIHAQDARGELGYWIGVDDWGKGYCTEAARCLVTFAREQLNLTRIVARCLARNPASARVMEKAGLTKEGFLPKDVRKNGKYEDILLYGLVLPGRDDS